MCSLADRNDPAAPARRPGIDEQTPRAEARDVIAVVAALNEKQPPIERRGDRGQDRSVREVSVHHIRAKRVEQPAQPAKALRRRYDRPSAGPKSTASGISTHTPLALTSGQAVQLLHATPRLDVRHRSVGLSDRVNREHRRVEHARDTVGQRLDALGVKVLVEQNLRERANRREPKRAPLLTHERPRRCPRALLRPRPPRLRCSHAQLYASAGLAWNE
jgi:hypothetical protein